jgi:uncharacterized metal-binding protein YceD (DUF177 family)
MTTYRKIFHQPLETLHIQMSQLAPGFYQVRGHFGGEAWRSWCQRADVPVGGYGAAKLTFQLMDELMEVTGQVEACITQCCTRTLELFTEVYEGEVWERLTLSEAHETMLPLDKGIFEVGEFVGQHLLLNLNMYPVHPDIAGPARGGTVVGDGFSPASPFEALKDLQILEESGKQPVEEDVPEETHIPLPMKKAS